MEKPMTEAFPKLGSFNDNEGTEYLLFAWEEYSERGGIHDLIAEINTDKELTDLLIQIEKMGLGESYLDPEESQLFCFHVIAKDRFKIILEGYIHHFLKIRGVIWDDIVNFQLKENQFKITKNFRELWNLPEED